MNSVMFVLCLTSVEIFKSLLMQTNELTFSLCIKVSFLLCFFGFFICFVPIILQLLLLYICVLLSERLAALLCVTGRRVTENAVATDISPLCPTIQSGSLRFRSFKYF